MNEGLVQEESPFKGTKRFGMCLTDQNGLAKYGCMLEIVHHECFEDGRIMILSKGSQRFYIDSVEQEKPVLLCKVPYTDSNSAEFSVKSPQKLFIFIIYNKIFRIKVSKKKV